MIPAPPPSWWWAPKNLYWWWTKALTTSSALYEGRLFLTHYGTAAALLGHAAFFALLGMILLRRKAFPALWLLPIAWAVVPMIESHNEGILSLLKRRDLSWETLVKPLEGFRFYCFLAQPLALCAGIVLDQGIGWVRRWPGKTARIMSAAIGFLLIGTLGWDLFFGYRLFSRFQNPVVDLDTYRAAVWFREQSAPTDRVVTEYFTAQVFIGVAGGKALEGSMFPLRNVALPHISQGWQVQRDIYAMYTSDDPETVKSLMRRYGCNTIVYSPAVLHHIEHITKGDAVLPDIEGLEKKDFGKTLFDPRQFEEVYRRGEVRLLKIRQG